jgi:hypothetical protein
LQHTGKVVTFDRPEMSKKRGYRFDFSSPLLLFLKILFFKKIFLFHWGKKVFP